MFPLVVLSALVAVSAAAPSGLGAPLLYSGPSLTVVEAHPQAYVASVPTSISSHSSSVVHDARAVLAAPSLVQVNAAPVVEVKSAPAVVASVPTSVTSYSSAVVHDARPVIAASHAVEAVEIIETAPAVEVKTAPKAAIVSVPETISSQSSTVVHDARAIVAAPLQYVSQYAAVGPAVEVRSAPVLQYAAAPHFAPHYAPAQYAAVQYAAPIAAHYSAAPIAVSGYSSHGLVNSAGLIASPVANVW